MNVIAIDTARRSYASLTPRCASYEERRPPRPLGRAGTVWLSRVPDALWFEVDRAGAIRPGADAADLAATGLFRKDGYGCLKINDESVRERLSELTRGLQSGRSLSAIFLTASGATFVADAFVADGEEEAERLGTVVLRRLKPAPWTTADLSAAYGLTHREAEVVLGMMEGHCVPDVADHLGLRAGTVRQYLKAIYEKTGTSTQAQLMAVLNGGSAIHSETSAD